MTVGVGGRVESSPACVQDSRQFGTLHTAKGTGLDISLVPDLTDILSYLDMRDPDTDSYRFQHFFNVLNVCSL